MICRFCGEDKQLIQAHIIPKPFFLRLWSDNFPPQLISANAWPKRLRIGVYDTEILCGECDGQFGPYDNYAQSILNENSLHSNELRLGGRVIGWEIPSYNYELLKMFFISLAWRASVSVHPFYQRIKLGPHEEYLKTMLRTKDTGTSDKYGVIVAHFANPLGKGLLDPHPEKYDGMSYARFYLGGFMVYIKIDKRVAVKPFSELQLHPERPLKIVARDFESSKERPLMLDLVSDSKK